MKNLSSAHTLPTTTSTLTHHISLAKPQNSTSAVSALARSSKTHLEASLAAVKKTAKQLQQPQEMQVASQSTTGHSSKQ